MNDDVGAAVAPVPDNWHECTRCGMICALSLNRRGLAMECPRCFHTIARAGGDFAYPAACGSAALLFYVVAVSAPFLEISAYGRFQLAGLATGPAQLIDQGFGQVGLLVFLVSILLPGVKVGIMLTTLLGLRAGLPRHLLRQLYRWYRPVSPWAMIDVYLLGFLVAYTRLTGIAQVHLDTALFALIGFMLCAVAADAALDDDAVWQALDDASPAPEMAPGAPIGCGVCGLLNQTGEDSGCRRCGAVLRRRKSGSIGTSWALAIAAGLFYIPANLYPVMLITQLARAQNFTIMGGIVELVHYGLWPLALLVFFASITIPLVKLATLGYLLLQTQRGSTRHLLGRTRAYGFVEFIGRWSMIDVFMISILVALVRFGQFANIQAEIGAPCFAAVVVLTMFAANAFDPRLMWDAQAAEPDHAAAQPA